MIINFTFENVLSFKDSVSIEFEASKERKNAENIPFSKKLHKKVSPLACIFGPNASGKTNFFKALMALKDLIMKVPNDGALINVSPFKLDSTHSNKPSHFNLCFLVEKDSIYTLDIVFDRQKIISENLSLKNTQGDRIVYTRDVKTIKFGDFGRLSEEKKVLLKVIPKSIPINRLLLNIASQPFFDAVKPLSVAINWFKKLTFISPDTRFSPLSAFTYYDTGMISKTLSELGIDVDNISLEDYPVEKLPKSFKDQLMDLTSGSVLSGLVNDSDFVFGRIQQGEIRAQKLCTVHNISAEQKIYMDFGDESDGTKRLLELLPLLMPLTSKSDFTGVILIDELDRSLHTLLTRKIIQSYIKSRTQDSRTQLIFSCHDLLLMDTKLLRLDQMFVFSKTNRGSEIRHLNDIEGVRTDKDLLRYYLEGNLGGIPMIK